MNLKISENILDLFSLLSEYDEDAIFRIANYPKELDDSKRTFTYPTVIEKGFLSVYPQLRKNLNAFVNDSINGNLCTLQQK